MRSRIGDLAEMRREPALNAAARELEAMGLELEEAGNERMGVTVDLATGGWRRGGPPGS